MSENNKFQNVLSDQWKAFSGAKNLILIYMQVHVFSPASQVTFISTEYKLADTGKIGTIHSFKEHLKTKVEMISQINMWMREVRAEAKFVGKGKLYARTTIDGLDHIKLA